jgi:hypothetical protein
MYDKSLIGILCDTLSPEDYIGINLNMAITLMLFSPKDIHWADRKIKGLVLGKDLWQESILDFPAAVYNQLYTSSSKIAKRLEKVIGKEKVFNIYTMFDKYSIYSIFMGSPLADYMIPTWHYDPILLSNRLSAGQTVLIKPAKGSFGNSVFKFKKTGSEYEVYPQVVYPTEKWNTTKQLFSYIDRIRIMNPSYNYVMQPFINFVTVGDNFFDMRFLVQKNAAGYWAVTADLCRISCDDFFITNMAYEILPVEKILNNIYSDMCNTLQNQMKDVSIKAAKIIENKLGAMGEICVDFGIEDNGRLRIIEINGKPDKNLFKHINKETYEKTMLTPLLYAEYLANQ